VSHLFTAVAIAVAFDHADLESIVVDGAAYAAGWARGNRAVQHRTVAAGHSVKAGQAVDAIVPRYARLANAAGRYVLAGTFPGDTLVVGGAIVSVGAALSFRGGLRDTLAAHRIAGPREARRWRRVVALYHRLDVDYAGWRIEGFIAVEDTVARIVVVDFSTILVTQATALVGPGGAGSSRADVAFRTEVSVVA